MVAQEQEGDAYEDAHAHGLVRVQVKDVAERKHRRRQSAVV